MNVLGPHGRLPEFDEGLAVPVSAVPKNAVVVWVSHCWGGTPARPDDKGNTKAKAIYEGLKVRKKATVLASANKGYPPRPPPSDNRHSQTCERSKTVLLLFLVLLPPLFFFFFPFPCFSVLELCNHKNIVVNRNAYASRPRT